jgi:Sec-independent protein translocase protein TatA
MKEFRKATSDITNEITNAAQAKPEEPASTTVTSDSAAKGPSEATPPPKN